MKRDRIFQSFDQNNFVVIGVPTDKTGKEMKKFLHRQELSNECKIKFTGQIMLHQDGRYYEDVKITSTHRADPYQIAQIASNYLPDKVPDGAIGVPCGTCDGKGNENCPECAGSKIVSP